MTTWENLGELGEARGRIGIDVKWELSALVTSRKVEMCIGWQIRIDKDGKRAQKMRMASLTECLHDILLMARYCKLIQASNEGLFARCKSWPGPLFAQAKRWAGAMLPEKNARTTFVFSAFFAPSAREAQLPNLPLPLPWTIRTRERDAQNRRRIFTLASSPEGSALNHRHDSKTTPRESFGLDT